MKAWKTISSTEIVKDEWISLRADECELPSGLRISPYYVLDEKEWVHICALDDDDRIVVVRQYRYGANVECMELPGGYVESDETPLDAARRELLEETGFRAADWQKVGTLFANPARQTNSIHIFLAQGLTRAGSQHLDKAEDISVELKTIIEIKDEISSGAFSQALHVASFYRCIESIAARVV